MSTNFTSHHPPATDHAHGPVPLETAFDFLNTLELENGALVERLTDFNAAVDWLASHGVVKDKARFADAAKHDRGREAALAQLVTTRTALRDVAHAVAHEDVPDAKAIEEVNRAMRSHQRIELVAAKDGCRLGHSHVGDPIDDVLARIAEPIVRQIGEGHDDRIRICASETCRWLFYDESRSGRRRWCDMATCGNRAKARRHRARQKDSTEATAAAAV